MQISFNLPHVFTAASSHEENAETLRNLLDFMVRENMNYRRMHPSTPTLYRSGVVYARTDIWEPIPALYARGSGDCKSLATALCAEYRERNIPAIPAFRFLPRKNGRLLYHILVMIPGQAVPEDPSKILGMGHHENAMM
jgi:hypothetical protein